MLELNLALDQLTGEPRPAESVGFRHGTRDAPHLPRRRARRGQDVRDAERGHRGERAAGPTSWSGTSRPTVAPNTAGADRRPRGRPPPAPSHYRGTHVRGDGRRRRSSPASPSVALVDELAHTNVPGSRNEKRWQDVEELLDAGIDVISTVNVQHLESMNDVVEQITGIKQRETIPDAVVRGGRPDRARRHDAARRCGGAWRTATSTRPRRSTPRSPTTSAQGNLGALRELALMWVADRVDEALEDVPRGARDHPPVGDAGAGRRRDHRRARRRRRDPPRRAHGRARARASCSACTCARPTDCAARRASALDEQRALLDELGGEYHELASADVADALVQFAQAENATQIVLGASRQSRWTHLLRGSVINNVIRASGTDRRARDLVGGRRPRTGAGAGRLRRAGARQRRRGLAAPPAAGLGPRHRRAAAAHPRPRATSAARSRCPSDLLLFLLVVVVVAALGGFVPGVRVRGHRVPARELVLHAAASTRSRSREGENLLALVVFLLVAGVVSLLVVDRVAAHRRGARRRAPRRRRSPR